MEDIVMDDSLYLDVTDVDASLASNSFMEDSFASFVGGNAIASTPNKPPPKKAASKIQKPTEKLECGKCHKFYANDRTLAIHTKMHTMKELSSRYPLENEVKQKFREFFRTSIEDLIIEEEEYDMPPDLLNYCKKMLELLVDVDAKTDFLESEILGILKQQNALLPSTLSSAVQIRVGELLSGATFIAQFREMCFGVYKTSDCIINLLSGPLMHKLCDKIVCYILNYVRGGTQASTFKRRSRDNVDSEEFKQLAFYIGGAVVCGILRRGRRYDTSQTWQTYIEVIKANFLYEPLKANQCSGPVRLFTEEVDRGGLKYLNEEAFSFFLRVFDDLMSLEGEDGSLSLKVVDENIFKNDIIIFLWDDLVGSDLSEELSLQLFNMMVHSCARVVSKGILKRRLSADLKKAYTSVSLRSRLSR